MKHRFINKIFIHCSAGFGGIKSQKRYWKSIGWKRYGYHREILLDGSVEMLTPYSESCNGVKYYNRNSIHISYTGGVERNNKTKAKDTRTEKQKETIICEIKNALEYLKEFQDISKIQILGHRDISPDKNLNGRVDSWERIKECPSFDAIPEYENIIKEMI